MNTQQLVVAVLIRSDLERTDECDTNAQDMADRASATPVTDLRFVRREPYTDAAGIDQLLYEGTGVPR